MPRPTLNSLANPIQRPVSALFSKLAPSSTSTLHHRNTAQKSNNQTSSLSTTAAGAHHAPLKLTNSTHTNCNPAPKQTAKMSTMPATGGHSEACCNIPPVVAKGYNKKGSYEELGGFKTYVTGPADATKGILVIMDIFGFFDQTLQGSDILATSDDHTKYKVFIPDWFHGSPAAIEWYPPQTDDQKKKLGEFFGKHPPPSVAGKVPDVIKAIEAKHPSIKSWGIIGYCWGGKVVSLTAAAGGVPHLKVGAEVHPAMVEGADAEKIKIPMVMLASKDEDADQVKKFEAGLAGPKHVEIFADQVHGWMAARADLADERVKAEYTRGYKTVLEFFGKHWN